MKNLLKLLFCAIIIVACKASEPQSEFSDLMDTKWILKDIEGQQPIPGTMISIQISTEHLSGSAGCNRYGAKYTLNSQNSFLVDELEINEADCLEPAGVMEQERNYTELLSSATTYQITNQELWLLNRQGKVILRYYPRQEFDVTPDTLIGKTGRLISADSIKADDLSQFTLKFNESTYNGTTICREYAGKYQAESDSLHITVMQMTTDQQCSAQDGLVEGKYTTLLSNVEQYNITSDHLELYTRHGEKLIFELLSK